MEYSKPLISVLMSVYGEPIEWIREAVDSILSQTFSQFEYIIVNDNPQRKDLEDLLTEFVVRDSRIHVVTNSENFGLTKSLNIGLNLCNGKYIARMDADDWSYPHRLQSQYEFMENNPDLLASSALAYSWNGYDKLKKIYRPIKYKDIISYTFTSSPFIHPLLILRKDKISQYGIKYDEHYRRSQDYKLSIDLLKFGIIENCNEYLLKYRVSDNQITSKFGHEQEELCKKIRRAYVNDFYNQWGINNLDNIITLNTIKANKHIETKLVNEEKITPDNIELFKTSMRSIRRLLYYSLSHYSIASLFYFLTKEDISKSPYNFRRIIVIILKHFNPEFVPKLL